MPMLEPAPPPVADSPIPLARPLLAEPAARPWFGSDLNLNEISRRDAWLDMILLLIVPIGMIYVPSMITWNFAPPGETPEIRRFDAFVAVLKWAELLLVALVAAYFVFRHGVRPRSMGIRTDGLGRQLAWAVATFVGAYAYLIITAMIAVPLMYFLGEEKVQQELAQRENLMRAIPGETMSLVITLLVAVGFHEELLFRGLLLTHMRRAFGGWPAAIVCSSLVFGALHFVQGAFAMFQITGLAIVLCLFFLASRSLLAVSLAHFAFNLCQFQMMQFVAKWMEWMKQQGLDPHKPFG
jgi:membrane protease YdiL (CAAX protease family)